MFAFNFILVVVGLSAAPIILLVLVVSIFYKVNSSKEFIKEKLSERFFFTNENIFALIFVLTIALLGAVMSINYWRDLPYVITGNYSVEEGLITKEKHTGGTGSHTRIVINDNTYVFHGSRYPTAGTWVRIKYLPNTKKIYKISSR